LLYVPVSLASLFPVKFSFLSFPFLLFCILSILFGLF
jgi:hypothetical protein